MKKFTENLGITLTETQLNQFKRYYDFLISENQKYNLTAITEEKEVYYKHFYDSLTLIKTGLIKEGTKICDIGSGAGFPSVPLKILYPSLEVTIVESQGKKAAFLNMLAKHLDMNITIINKRAEEYAHTQYFDVVTARAVANLSVLLELCIPYVKKEGYFIAMKGFYQDELKSANNAIKTLGGRFVEVIHLDLPHQMGERNLIVIKKENMVLGFPRPYAQIKKKPL